MAIQRGTEAWSSQARAAANYMQQLFGGDLAHFATRVSWAQGFTSWDQVFNVLNSGGSGGFNNMMAGNQTYQQWQGDVQRNYQQGADAHWPGPIPGSSTGPGSNLIPPNSQPSPLPPPTPFVPPPPGSIYDPVTGTYKNPPAPPTPPGTGLPGAQPGAPLPDVRTNAKAEMTRLLGQFGLAGLADIAWQLYTVSNITDPNELVMALEPTQEFQRLFPGLRDPASNELLMTPAQWTNYYDQVQSLVKDVGGDNLTRAQVGALIQNRRSVSEIAKETQEIQKLELNPYAKQEFYAYTGHIPTGQDLYALRLGLHPDLESLYNTSVANGVSAEQFNQRMSQFPLTQQTAPEQASALTPGGPGFNATQFPANSFGLEQAFQQSLAASEARWQSGGAERVETSEPKQQQAF